MHSTSIQPLLAQMPLAEYTAQYVDIPKFYACCQACPNFGRRWSCPPFSFRPEELWRSYETIALHGRKLRTPPELLAQSFPPEQLQAQYESLLRPVRQELDQCLLALEGQTPGSLALFAGSCASCQTCTRQQGAPCRHPEPLRYSIEALGGDVSRTISQGLGERLLWAEAGKLPPHFILLGGLLLPHTKNHPAE